MNALTRRCHTLLTNTLPAMEEADYSQYRLTAHDDFIEQAIEQIGLKELFEFEEKVYLALDLLKEGKYYNVSDVQADRIELFIKIACLYIQHHPQVVFNNSYTRIYKEVKYESRKMDKRRKEIRNGKRR